MAHANESKQPPPRKGEVAAHVRRCMQPPQKRQHEFATAEKQHECHAPGMRAKARGNHADNAPPSRPRTAPAKAGTRHVAPRPLRRRSPDEVQGPHTHPASKSSIGGAASASVIEQILIQYRNTDVSPKQIYLFHFPLVHFSTSQRNYNKDLLESKSCGCRWVTITSSGYILNSPPTFMQLFCL